MGHSSNSRTAGHTLSRKLGIMLFLLAVLTAASAAPQIPLSPYYNPYLLYYPQYQVQRQAPLYYYPSYPSYTTASVAGMAQSPQARLNWPIGGFMQEGAAFTAMAAVTTSGSEMSAKTLTGDITFYQNPLTLNNAKYHINLHNVAALKAGQSLQFRLVTSCTNTNAAATAGTEITKLSMPPILINGAYVDGTTNLMNIDGAGSKMDVSGKYVSIIDTSVTGVAGIIGCTSAGLA